MKKQLYFVLMTCAFLLGIHVTEAHVVVTPSEVEGDSYQVFTIGVPVERDVPTVGVRLVIPEGVTSVRPNVRSDWTITTKKQLIGEKNEVTEITWSGGSIPSGLRDEFVFSAKVPEKGQLNWKAYQTYQDGKVVAWDETPADEHGHNHESVEGPYSITEITEHDHAEHDAGSGHIGHDMLLPLLGIGIGLACVIEINKDRKAKKVV
jgi:uncharacterized protein YcnI